MMTLNTEYPVLLSLPSDWKARCSIRNLSLWRMTPGDVVETARRSMAAVAHHQSREEHHVMVGLMRPDESSRSVVALPLPISRPA